MSELRIESRDATRVLGVRHTGPYKEIANAYAMLCGWAYPKGYIGESTRVLGMYFDDPENTPQSELRAIACITWPEHPEVVPEGPVEEHEIPAGEYAVFTHVGSYENLVQSYQKLMRELLPAAGRECSHESPAFEVYIDDPEKVPEAELRTEINMPLAPKN